MKADRYKESGVDIDTGNRFVEMIKPLVRQTYHSGVITDIGSFSGLISLPIEGMAKPVLVGSTDGVGTKLRIAQMLNRHNTIGVDLVAMCVNDIIVNGAKPLFFLDYLAMGKLDPDLALEIVEGIAEGCKQASCALIGGETAEMPGFYKEGEYELAGFVVGIVDNDRIIDGSEVGVGDKLIGIASSGLHSNGYSLVRKIVFEELAMQPDTYVEQLQTTIGEELLKPTKIYWELIHNLIRDFKLLGISHITGGGIVDNLPRILPRPCQAVVYRGSWDTPPIFNFLQENGNIPQDEMARTFNIGLGLIIVVQHEQADEIAERAKAMGETAYLIGEIAERAEGDVPIRFVNS